MVESLAPVWPGVTCLTTISIIQESSMQYSAENLQYTLLFLMAPSYVAAIPLYLVYIGYQY